MEAAQWVDLDIVVSPLSLTTHQLYTQESTTDFELFCPPTTAAAIRRLQTSIDFVLLVVPTVPKISSVYQLQNAQGIYSEAECFSSVDRLQLRGGGTKPMVEAVVGDEVLTVTSTGVPEYSPIVYLPHGQNIRPATFMRFTIEGGRTIAMTPEHLIVALPDCIPGRTAPTNLLSHYFKKARNVTINDCVLIVAHEGSVDMARVVGVDLQRGAGVYTVITHNPYLVVNGIIASPHATYHSVPHALYHVVRTTYRVAPSVLKSQLFAAAMSWAAWGYNALVSYLLRN